MTRAILISGAAYRFTQEQREMERYLVREVGIGRNQIKCFSGATSDRHNLLDFHLVAALHQKSPYPLIVHYNGHGTPTGWSIDEDQSLRFDALSLALRSARRQVLLVSDCCHAMALARQCEGDGVLPERVGVIGASERGETVGTWLSERLRECWKRHRPHRLDPALHWGASLDHHFYPSEPEG